MTTPLHRLHEHLRKTDWLGPDDAMSDDDLVDFVCERLDEYRATVLELATHADDPAEEKTT